MEGPVGTAELLVDVDVGVDDVVGSLLVEELDVVGATEELEEVFDVLLAEVNVDEVDLTELDVLGFEDDVDLMEFDALLLEDVEDEDVTVVFEVEELFAELTDVDFTEDKLVDVDELIAVLEN